MFSRISSWVFIGSIVAFVFTWGYLPDLWVMGWPKWVLLGLSVAGLLSWFFFSLDAIGLWIKQRSTQFGLGLVITALMTLGILGALNYVAVTFNKTWDVTKNRSHTLSDQTNRILTGLNQDILIRVWSTNVQRMGENIDVRRFLARYEEASKGRVKVEIKNPNNERAAARMDNVNRDNLIIVGVLGPDKKILRESRVDSFSESKGEEQITNAILQARRGGGGKKVVCFLEGHGELSIDAPPPSGLTLVRQSLQDSGYETKTVDLTGAKEMAKDCEALVVAGPQSEAPENTTKMIDSWVMAGGKMLALFGPGTPEGWLKLPAKYGVKVQQNVVLDPRTGNPFVVVAKNYAQDVEITKDFRLPTLFPEASSIQVPTSNSFEGATVRAFLNSDPSTVAKAGSVKSLAAKGSIELRGSDPKGPFALGVLITKPVPQAQGSDSEKGDKGGKKAPPTEPKQGFWNNAVLRSAWAQDGTIESHSHGDGHDHGHDHGKDPHAGLDMGAATEASKSAPQTSLVVIGNHNFIVDGVVRQAGNMDLFLNTVNFLLQDTEQIGIRPRELKQASLDLSQERIRKVYATILLIAGLFLVGGIRAGRRKSVFLNAKSSTAS